MPNPAVTLIAAVARDGGIGRAGELLVRLPGDLARFKRLTMGAPVVMGRKTWESIGRALPGRRNIVVTRDRHFRAEGAETVTSLDAGLALVAPAPRVFVIGGGELYALALPVADELELTEVDAEFPADAFFPRWDRADFTETRREAHESAEGVRYAFTTYKKNP
ncbi:MAG: dihydrofolate reductase [Caldimonas sp.]